MTDLAVVARIGARVDALGGVWMGGPVMAAGSALGFEGYPWPFYMVGRGGVLGDVDPDVVAAAMVFPSPTLVRSAWKAGRERLSPEEGVARFIECAYGWAAETLARAPGLERAADLLGRLVSGVDCSRAPLAAGWREVPAPAVLPQQVIGQIQVLREHRGGVHGACVLGAGMTPLEAVMATEGEFMADIYGWERPYPDAEECKIRKSAVETATNEQVGADYRVLAAGELEELAVVLEALPVG